MRSLFLCARPRPSARWYYGEKLRNGAAEQQDPFPDIACRVPSTAEWRRRRQRRRRPHSLTAPPLISEKLEVWEEQETAGQGSWSKFHLSL